MNEERMRQLRLTDKEAKELKESLKKMNIYCLERDFHGGEHWWEEYVFKGYVRRRSIETFNEWYAKVYGKEFIK